LHRFFNQHEFCSMKKSMVLILLVCIAAPFTRVFSQNTTEGSPKVSVFPGVLKAAEWAGFDYNGTLNKALTGDYYAVQKLLDFHTVVDGANGINHGVTCLEIIPIIGDELFATGCSYMKPKLQKTALDRIILGQGRTQKEELRQSLTNWAPLTWSVLNGNGMPVIDKGEVKPVEAPPLLKLIPINVSESEKGKN